MEGASSQSHSMSASKQLTVLYYNAKSILPKLDELQANVLLQKPDIICIVENWTRKFLEIMEECIPQQELKKKRRNLPWLTKNVVRHMQKRNNMFPRAKRSKNPTHFAKYKKIRNNVTTMLRSAKQSYFNSLTSANSKQFWKTVNL